MPLYVCICNRALAEHIASMDEVADDILNDCDKETCDELCAYSKALVAAKQVGAPPLSVQPPSSHQLAIQLLDKWPQFNQL